jgi:tetratricopeptide (TPR) repeat protein
LSPRERLGLFVPVCHAIQHAHQKGIIHRDIKPSNVMVTLIDGKPVPKVIDFGVAKATEQRLTERTMFTEYGAIIGTPEYMSPEQAELSGLDVDTRGDVYSLGVLLYELLTGSTPLERSTLRAAGYDEILQRIKHEEPPKPSTRISHSGDRLASIAAVRRIEPARLTKLVRGELDWIVMKALEKERTRRYDTANGMARDIQRYLDGDPVEAGPPSALYKLRKFARKHRATLVAASAFASLLLAAIVVTSVLAIRAIRAEADTKRALDESQAVLKFFQDKVLAATRPEDQEGGLGRKATIRQAIDAAEPKIAESFRVQPAVEASIRNALGETYRFLGEPDLAIAQHERSLQLRRRVLGPNDGDTLDSMNNLAQSYVDADRLADAIPLYEECLRASKNKRDRENTLAVTNNLAIAYEESGHPERALALFEEAIEGFRSEFGEDDLGTVTMRSNLCLSYIRSGQAKRAVPLLAQALKTKETKLGRDHVETLEAMNNLAVAHQQCGQFDQAIVLFEAVLKAQQVKLGADHPRTLACQSNLAGVYRITGDFDRAIAIEEEVLKAKRAKLGEYHADTLLSMNNLALSLMDASDFDRAILILELLLRTLRDKKGEDHPYTLPTWNNLARAYHDSGRVERAIPLHEQTLKARQTKLGEKHIDTLYSMNSLASAYRDSGQLDRAIPLHEETLKRFQATLGDHDPRTQTVQRGLARAYEKAGRDVDAEPLYHQMRFSTGQATPRDDRPYADSLAWLGQCLIHQKKFAEAVPILRECLEIKEKTQPGNWTTANARSLLGEALAGQRKFDEAKPLLEDAQKALADRREKIKPIDRSSTLHEAIDRLVRLYEAWGKPAEAEEWRAKLFFLDLPIEVFAAQ